MGILATAIIMGCAAIIICSSFYILPDHKKQQIKEWINTL